MSASNLKLDQIVTTDALKAGVEAIVAEHTNGADTAARTAFLALLRQTMQDGRTAAEAMLFEDGKGLSCAKRLAHLQDVVIQTIFEFAMRHVFKAAHLSTGERMAIVAVGGYGRRTMAPGSDVDLLFLLPYKQTPLSEQIAEYTLYMLWDLGLKVGHATRNVDECLRQSKADMTICTSVLEARFITGDAQLFAELEECYNDEIIKRISSQFIKDKLAERDQRHKRMGESRYVVEPNVKDGKGALRDLHTLFWIAKMSYRVRKRSDLVSHGVFSRADYRRFSKCEDFLWAVRCHLHFLTKRAEERISFDVQRELAQRLGYQSHPGMLDVERFMKHYFLIVKDVGNLTRIFCAQLEERDLKQAPALNTLFHRLVPIKRSQKIKGENDFIVDNQRINVAEPDVFSRDPVNIIRMFSVADRHGLEYHPDALQALRGALRQIDGKLRSDPDANRHFMDVLTSHHDPELNLRRMNEAGVLGKFLPDFGKIVAMMQFNMYHHFTVDEHLIQAVGVLSAIERKAISEDHPLAARLLPRMDERDRRILYTTLLLHDIAKGRPEDHSIAGAKVARRLCPRLGFDADDTETIAWLIEEHLTMSTVAQSRDLNDRKTIDDFAKRVQSLRRLKLLLVLTVCDIRAVGPGVWNGWKGQLLRTLYAETELMLTGGYSEANRDKRIEMARASLADALIADIGSHARHYAELHYGAYLLSTSSEDQIRHTRTLHALDQSGEKLDITVSSNAFQAITQLTVITPDHPRLLAVLAAACASAEAKIDSAQAFTTSDGRAIDTLLINREFDDDADEYRRGNRIADKIRGLLTGETRSADIVRKGRRGRKNTRAFRVETVARINNMLSNRFSVIEIEALDRPGLLYDITSALSDLALDIQSAHITTFGEKAVDTFYVTDLVGQKITSKPREQRIIERLTEVMQPDYAGEAKRPLTTSSVATMQPVS